MHPSIDVNFIRINLDIQKEKKKKKKRIFSCAAIYISNYGAFKTLALAIMIFNVTPRLS